VLASLFKLQSFDSVALVQGKYSWQAVLLIRASNVSLCWLRSSSGVVVNPNGSYY